MDGMGVYNWAKGHEYKGAFRDGQMEGEGTFTNKNGTVLSGKFKRNQFDSVSSLTLFSDLICVMCDFVQAKDKVFINPLDDAKL